MILQSDFYLYTIYYIIYTIQYTLYDILSTLYFYVINMTGINVIIKFYSLVSIVGKIVFTLYSLC